MTQEKQDELVQVSRDKGIADALAGVPPLYSRLNGVVHYYGPGGVPTVTDALGVRRANAYIAAYEANY